MKTRLLMIGGLLGGMLFHSCYNDLGNYDYREINEVMIGDAGFADTVYYYRSYVDTLRISPQVDASLIQDPENYEYNWILGGNEIGNQKDLVWPVNRPQGNYVLYLRVKDKSTGVVVTRQADVRLQTNFSTGWLVWGENEDGEAQLDMLSFVNEDTLLMKDILNGQDLPVLKKPTFLYVPNTYMRGNEIQLGSENGSYRLDRNSLIPVEDAHLKYVFWEPSLAGNCVLTDANRLQNCQFAVIDGNLYFDNNLVAEGEKLGNPSNHYRGDYELFKMGAKVGFDYNYMSAAIVVYDDDNKCFLYQGGSRFSGFSGYCQPVSNVAMNDEFWAPGKDFVTTINSRQSMISNYTILKNSGASSSADYYLYPYKINAGSFDVTFNDMSIRQMTNAEEIDNAEFYACSSQKAYIFYTVGSRLYGFDYSTSRGKLLLDFGGDDRIWENGQPVTETITAMWNEQYMGYGVTFGDVFYLGLYDSSKPASSSGRLVGYRVIDDANDIIIEEIPGSSRSGFCKIASIAYK